MNLHLEALLQEASVTHRRLNKGEKVKQLSRWSRAFPTLITSARGASALRGAAAEEAARGAPADHFFALPDDASAMPAYECSADAMPDLKHLVSDEVTSCQVIVLLDAQLRWAFVLENGGAPSLIGQYFSWKEETKRHQHL